MQSSLITRTLSKQVAPSIFDTYEIPSLGPSDRNGNKTGVLPAPGREAFCDEQSAAETTSRGIEARHMDCVLIYETNRNMSRGFHLQCRHGERLGKRSSVPGEAHAYAVH
jgi:hypothetical protein